MKAVYDSAQAAQARGCVVWMTRREFEMKFLISWSNSPATIDAALETIARLDWSQVDALGESLGVNHVTTYYRNDFSGFSVVEAADLATVTHFCRLFPGSMIEPVFDRDEAATVAKRIVETRQRLPTA